MNKASMANNSILQYSLDLFDSLFKEYCLECDLRQIGFLLLFKDKKYFKNYNSTIVFLKKYGFTLKRYEQIQVREFEPAVKKRLSEHGMVDVTGTFDTQYLSKHGKT